MCAFCAVFKGLFSIIIGCAEALLFIYNRKMKYPLDYLRLHSGKGRKKILTDYVEEDDDEDLFFTPSLADDSDHEDKIEEIWN